MVEVILAMSESWIGERNSDSGMVEVVPKVNARACVGVGVEDIWEVQYSFVLVINGATTSAGPFLFARARSSTLRSSVLMMAANCGPKGWGQCALRGYENERMNGR